MVLSSIDSEIVFGGLLIVGSTFLLKNSIGEMNESTGNKLGELRGNLGELKNDVKDIRTNFNYLYAGFGISVALLTGFNAVSDGVKNLAAVQEQAAKTEKLRIEVREEKKKTEDAAEFELLKRQRDFYLLEKK